MKKNPNNTINMLCQDDSPDIKGVCLNRTQLEDSGGTSASVPEEPEPPEEETRPGRICTLDGVGAEREPGGVLSAASLRHSP